jgi:molybdopterin molybdotransferase
MITVDQALEQLFALVNPLEIEWVHLTQAVGRVLAQDVTATRSQPPFSASAMDGYAICVADAVAGRTLTVIGEAAAGHRFDGTVQAGQAARIFTGAPVPAGANHVIIQEDVTRAGDQITLNAPLDKGTHIRPAAGDFAVGDGLHAPRKLSPSDIALAAAMNIATLPVTRKPTVAIIATGDELVQPGETPNADQIIASNSYGLYAMLTTMGAEPRLLPIAKDRAASLETVFGLAQEADLIVTIGGASVGDHDLVADVAQNIGMDRAFYKVRMRPGKPLMAGKIGQSTMIGLPGNPVSAMVCGHVFLAPVIAKMLGLPAALRRRRSLPLAHDIDANGPREHYMRGQITDQGVTVFDRQDSSLLTVLADANVLVVRNPQDPARSAGDLIEVIDIAP